MKGFIKGLLVGSTIGGLVSLFTTQKPGKETRQALKQQVKQTTQKIADVKDSYQNVQLQQEKLAQTVQTVVPKFQEGLEKDLKKFEFQAKPRIERINQQLATLSKHLETFKSRS